MQAAAAAADIVRSEVESVCAACSVIAVEIALAVASVSVEA